MFLTFLRCRLKRGTAVLAFVWVALLCFFSPFVSAQMLPLPFTAESAPAWSPVRVPIRVMDRCVLLSQAMCDGLRSDPINGVSDDPPIPPNSGTAHGLGLRLIHDQAGIYSSPFHRANLKWDAVFLAATAALIATDKRTIGEVSNAHIDLSRNISNAGIYGTGAAAGAIWLTGIVTHDPHAQETGYLTTEALVNALPIYAGLQLIGGRGRPNEGDGHGRVLQNHSIKSSFPSCHPIFALPMASVIAHQYPHKWVKVLVYGAAGAVSVTRFTGREQFASDIAVGSILGYLIGRHVFHVHCNADFSEACR